MFFVLLFIDKRDSIDSLTKSGITKINKYVTNSDTNPNCHNSFLLYIVIVYV